MGHLVDQLIRGVVLLHGRLVQPRGLAVQLLRHGGQPVRGGPEAQERLIHRFGNGAKAAPDQLEIALVVYPRPGTQVAARHAGQHLLNIGYVLVDAPQRLIQGLGHDLQLIPGADGDHLRVQIAVGKGHHPFRHPGDRPGDGTGEPQDQQD